MFDCVIVDFQNKNSSLKYLSKIFPHAKIIPFIESYNYIINKVINEINTEHFWLLSTKVNYDDFDFDYIPEQHEKYQMHTWANNQQKEGDTFLIPTHHNQSCKFLRDFKDINYHTYNGGYDFDMDSVQYNLSNVIDSLPNTNKNKSRYVKYYENESSDLFYPSYWEDLKIYKTQNTFYIPYQACEKIKTQIYDYHLIHTITESVEKDNFDIVFISNGEPFEQNNYDILKKHCDVNNLPNRLHWVKGVNGRTKAYKVAAESSGTEYFFAVFAKSIVRNNFMFDYTVDRGVSKKHRIFHSYLKEVDLAYGTFNINLYNKSLCLDTPDNSILDFTLSQPHEVVSITASDSLLAPDNYTAWKNAFREVSKLVLWQKQKPTVETNYRLSKWLKVDNEWLAKGAIDGKKFTEDCNYEIDKILSTYTWDFCRDKFRSLYPNETFY